MFFFVNIVYMFTGSVYSSPWKISEEIEKYFYRWCACSLIYLQIAHILLSKERFGSGRCLISLCNFSTQNILWTSFHGMHVYLSKIYRFFTSLRRKPQISKSHSMFLLLHILRYFGFILKYRMYMAYNFHELVSSSHLCISTTH